MTCTWCGKPYNEHLDSRPRGAPVPRMPCVGLKAHYFPNKGSCQDCDAEKPWDELVVCVRHAPPYFERTVRCFECNEKRIYGETCGWLPNAPILQEWIYRAQVDANPSIVLGED